METIEQKLIKLVNDLNETNVSQNDCLLQMKALLISANCQQIQEVVQQLNIKQLFIQLNEMTDNTNIALIVSILRSILDSLSPTYVLTHFQNEINSGLKSKNESIVELWLKTLDNCFGEELAVKSVIGTDVDIRRNLLEVVRLLSSESTCVANYCHSILLNISKTDAINSMFFEEEIQKELIAMTNTNELVRIRVYQLLVSIANTSQSSLYRIENLGHLKHILDDLSRNITNDPLIALNILQILTDLGSTPFGIQYLKTSDILKPIANRLANNESDIFANLLIPGYVKLFATLASTEPLILNEHPIVLKALIKLMDESDPTLKLCALDAIANICLTNCGKKIVNEEPQMAKTYTATIGSLLTSGSAELKTRALDCLSNVLQVSEPDPTGEASALTESWFRLILAERTMPTLLALCKEPFMEIRLPALECIRVLASNVWGQKELAAFPGFLEYILDRSTESAKNGKEAKYCIVRELVVSPFITLSFTKEAVQRLRTFYKEGPYYVESETAVSFESQN